MPDSTERQGARENADRESGPFLSRLFRTLKRRLANPPVETFTDPASGGRGLRYRGNEFVYHSELPVEESALYTFSVEQKMAMIAAALVAALAFAVSWHWALVVLFALVTAAYAVDLGFGFYLMYKSLRANAEIAVSPRELAALTDAELPSYTVFCPLYKEWQVVPQFVEAMERLDYPKGKLQVLFLLEEDDRETVEKISSRQLPKNFEIVVTPNSKPKTKPKAMNWGLRFATGEIITIYDAEDKPEPDQLKKAVVAFRRSPKNTVCVQAKLNFYNPNQNLLTKLFTAEYSLWFDVVLPGLQSVGAPIPLGGTSNHFLSSAIRELNGWDAFNVTEDCDLGLRLSKRGYQTAIVDSTTYEEANSGYLNWYRQRSRWIKGYIQSYLVHMRRPQDFTGAEQGYFKLFAFQVAIGGKVISMFVNPFLWLVTFAYFAFRSVAAPIIEPLFPSPVLYTGVACLVFGNFLYLYYYIIGTVRRDLGGLTKYAAVVPFYWLAMSAAAWQGLYEVFVKPHYWAKTQHGLHLKPAERVAASGQRIASPELGLAYSTTLNAKPSTLAARTIPVRGWQPTVASVSVQTSVGAQPATAGRPAARLVVEAVETEAVFGPTLSAQLKAALRRDDVREGAVLTGASLLSNFIYLVGSAYLGRTLTLEQFAAFSVFNTLTLVLGIFLGALQTTTTHHVAYASGDRTGQLESFWKSEQNARWLALGFSAAWVAFMPLLGVFFGVQNLWLLVSYLPVIALTFLASPGRGYLKGRARFAVLGYGLVVEAAVKLLASLVLGRAGAGVWVVLSLPAAAAAAYAVTRLSLRGTPARTPARALPAGRFSWKFFSAVAVSAAASAVFMTADVLLAKHYLPGAEAGEYALLSLVGNTIFFLGSLASVYTVTYVSRAEGQGKSSAGLFSRIVGATAAVSFTAWLGLVLLGSTVLPFVFGPKIAATFPYLTGYGAAIAFFTVSSAVTGYHLARRRYIFSLASLAVTVALITGISAYHGSTGDIVRVVFLTSVGYLLSVSALHAFRDRNWFLARAFRDLFDVLLEDAVPHEALNVPGKRILAFNWRDTRHAFAGGAEIYIHELARRWVAEGNHVTLFCGSDGAQARSETVDGVHVVRRGGFYLCYLWAALYYFCQFRGRYDVVVDCHNGIPFFTPLFTKEPVYCLMHHVHQEVFYRYLPRPLAAFAAFLEGTVMPFVYRNTPFITISNSSRSEMESLGLGLSGISMVHPGVDLAGLEPGERDPLPTILYLGRLKAYKSVDVLIRAFAQVLSRVPNAQLAVVGGGEELGNLEKLARELGVAHRVTFAGKVDEAEKLRWYQRAWVFVNPSMMEGWGITTIEANACGVPVVAADVPGLRDSVKAPDAGVLVPHGDADGFAEAIANILERPTERRAMGRQGIQWAKNFGWDRSAAQFFKLIYQHARSS